MVKGGCMIKPICRMCEKELKAYGGLLISPPDENELFTLQTVVKSHLCKHCYEIITDFIRKTKAINAVIGHPEYEVQDHLRKPNE